MESAELSKNELIDLIFYGIKENNVDIENINQSEIESIIREYITFCNHFQIAYVKGELDTFKRAACLLVAINRGELSRYKRVNASIALDAAYKMCEKPYWNVGENFDIPKKMEEVDYKKVFENNMDIYNYSKEMLIDSLVYENGVPLNYNLNLELFYYVALEIKKSKLNSLQSDQKIEEPKKLEKNKKKSKKLSLFQRLK